MSIAMNFSNLEDGLKSCVCFIMYKIRVGIIALHFANCEVNSSYFDCKIVNHTNVKHFFPLENLICPHFIFSHYIHI